MPPLIPSLHPRSSRKLIDFLHAALGAEAMEVHEAAGRVAYAKVRLGESVLDMGDAHGPFQPMPTTFFVNVTDVDTAYARATAAGAEIMSPPADAPHGSRVAAVRDPEQNEWYLAAPIKPR
jgi:PhnB protein